MNAVLETPIVAAQNPHRPGRPNIATNPKLSAFYRWLHRRPLPEDPSGRYNQQRLADDVMTSRAQLSLVLSGARRGRYTWRRVVQVLPLDGLLLLQQCPAWNIDAEAAWKKRKAKINPLAAVNAEAIP